MSNDVSTGYSSLKAYGDDVWMEIPINPAFSYALGEGPFITIFNLTIGAVQRQVANRLFFAHCGSMRYPGCHSDVVFDVTGRAL